MLPPEATETFKLCGEPEVQAGDSKKKKEKKAKKEENADFEGEEPQQGKEDFKSAPATVSKEEKEEEEGYAEDHQQVWAGGSIVLNDLRGREGGW